MHVIEKLLFDGRFILCDVDALSDVGVQLTEKNIDCFRRRMERVLLHFYERINVLQMRPRTTPMEIGADSDRSNLREKERLHDLAVHEALDEKPTALKPTNRLTCKDAPILFLRHNIQRE